MSARAPRRTFANPFVLTLAAIPTACAVQSGTAPSSTQPSREHQHVHNDMMDHPQPGHEQPQPAEQPTTPPTMTPVANPPRPDSSTSNTDVSPQADQTANTTNAGMQQSRPNMPPKVRGYREWSVSHQLGTCTAMVKVHCPDGAMCNPPPPAKYTCPKFMADGDRIDVVQRAEKSDCFVDFGEPSCPPNAKCNPPKPQKVACPK